MEVLHRWSVSLNKKYLKHVEDFSIKLTRDVCLLLQGVVPPFERGGAWLVSLTYCKLCSLRDNPLQRWCSSQVVLRWHYPQFSLVLLCAQAAVPLAGTDPHRSKVVEGARFASLLANNLMALESWWITIVPRHLPVHLKTKQQNKTLFSLSSQQNSAGR